MSSSYTPATLDSAFEALLDDVARADAPSSVIHLKPEQRIGPLVLRRPLGRGGMGEVWEAWHEGLGRAVALKVLLHAPGGALHEAVTLERLRHPNVVPVLGFGQLDDGPPYVVMERLVGETLTERVERVGPLNSTEAVALVQQLGAALEHAHGHGVVHRDIKPSNLFLVKTDDGAIDLRVIDFGLSQLAPRVSPGAGALDRAGTPSYMSPEQRTSPDQVDGRSDLWSAAAVVHFALTTRKPDPPGQMPTMNEARTRLPASLRAWFDRALEEAPERRFPTAHRWAQAFKQASERGGELLPYPQALYANGELPRATPAKPPVDGSAPIIPGTVKLVMLLVVLVAALIFVLLR